VEGQLLTVGSINTGVPHVVHYVEDIDRYDVLRVGRAIRYHEAYRPAGTNANFVKVDDRHAITVRTYERGVEDETLACGTGSVASVLISAGKGLVETPVAVKVKSGETLTVHFTKTGTGFGSVYLEGRVRVVYEGRLWEEAYGEKS
jgi:diaminopimelate epimerase